ncbi:MAG: Gfo/Idh/MocA family oxidoreductase [Candidatus Anammoximicrobium sp.]|nr:Gfo/Idh/MocA family oxidoreductase [Candidatus Anammoximicrobium sp.]
MMTGQSLTRRTFVERTAAATVPLLAAASTALAQEAGAKPAAAVSVERKVRLGFVGLGSRGSWIANLFKQHPGYEIVAAADYFEETVNTVGERLGVPAGKRFSGLSGYKRVLDSGVEALVLKDIPYFYPEQAAAAIDAGVHLYTAKPFAVDVPAVFAMQALAKKATEKKLCFRVDYQLPTDEANQEVKKRIAANALGGLAHIYSGGTCGKLPDPPVGPTIENLFRRAWYSHIGLSGDLLLLYDIHIIDGVVWSLGQRAVAAGGYARIVRPDPHGDRSDCGGVVFQLQDGTCWTHATQLLQNNAVMYNLAADIMGLEATAHIAYSGQVFIRGGSQHYSGAASGSIYADGAKANIAEFYRCITQGEFDNATAHRSVDSTLTGILGREAMLRKTWLTMDELIKEGKTREVNLRGLKT